MMAYVVTSLVIATVAVALTRWVADSFGVSETCGLISGVVVAMLALEVTYKFRTGTVYFRLHERGEQEK